MQHNNKENKTFRIKSVECAYLLLWLKPLQTGGSESMYKDWAVQKRYEVTINVYSPVGANTEFKWGGC